MPKKVPFGQPLGVALGGVVAYSSHYESADPEQFPTRRSYISFHNDIYTGYKYQCVEFARRWLVSVAGITFGDVNMAYQIFNIPGFVAATAEGDDDEAFLARSNVVPAARDVNGGTQHRPVPGSLLLWHPAGYFQHTGHVAVVTAVTDAFVRVAEQNVTDRQWPEGQDYARELPVKIGADGGFTIVDSHFASTKVLGWVTPGQLLRAPGSAL
jgi:glutathionylspermidine amidase/synthetase